MHDPCVPAHVVQALSGAAGHLCSALDEVETAGYDAFATAILRLLVAIDDRITSLDEVVGRTPSAPIPILRAITLGMTSARRAERLTRDSAPLRAVTRGIPDSSPTVAPEPPEAS